MIMEVRHLRQYAPDKLDKGTLRHMRDGLIGEIAKQDEIRSGCKTPETLKIWDDFIAEERAEVLKWLDEVNLALDASRKEKP